MTAPNGHELLLQDLRRLLAEAEAFAFDDFKNATYATPKRELVSQLGRLAKNVMEGKYDQ